MRASGSSERLRRAMDAAGYSVEKLAAEVGYHPKQVGRWVTRGMVPRRVGVKAAVAERLNVVEDEIWPAATYAASPSAPINELVDLWTHRADMPTESWWELLTSATRQIDLMGCAMLFLPEQHPRLHRFVAETGVRVRLMLLDPDGDEAPRRDQLEGLGGTLPARIRTTLHHFAPLIACPTVELRFVDKPLYNAVYRFDDQMLVTPYLVGWHGYQHPLLHLRRLSDGGIFASYAEQFETLWAKATG